MSQAAQNAKIATLVIIVVVIGALALFSQSIVENVERGTYHIKQAAVSGKVTAHMNSGWYGQWFGDIDVWPNAETFYFTADIDEGEKRDQSLEVRFVDGSLCRISGSCRVQMPGSDAKAILLVTDHNYRTYKNLESELLLKVIRSATRLSANMMTVRESYAEKRQDFLFWTWDQIQNGLYKTQDERRETIDASGKITYKTFKVIAKDENGDPLRQKNPFEGLDLTLSNFEIKDFVYEDKVKAQISTQQEALMAVATAITKSALADQEAKTKEAEGKALVMEAQYKQEQIKIVATVMADQEAEVANIEAQKLVDVAELTKLEAEVKAAQAVSVAELDKEAAAAEKEAAILRAEGEAESKQLVLAADNALEQKLETYERVQSAWAEAFATRPVPNVMVGAGYGEGLNSNDPLDLQQAIAVKVLSDIDLNIGIKRAAPVAPVATVTTVE